MRYLRDICPVNAIDMMEGLGTHGSEGHNRRPGGSLRRYAGAGRGGAWVPITPQTIIIEQITEFINDGIMDADFIPAESEHSVMSVAVGASAGGVRTFTATSSQGLALMYEMLFAAAPIRLPVVMAVANRSVGGASGIWTEHNDSVPVRESGWLQVYVEDCQEALDMTIRRSASPRTGG